MNTSYGDSGAEQSGDMKDAFPPARRAFEVKAEIRYHVILGTFYAQTLQEAIEQAEQSATYMRVSRVNKGGVYDMHAQELPGSAGGNSNG